MRCRQCDYPLWNLPTRACPECGTPFRPSDFDFTPGTVEFCCPHCGQGYFGTSARGHLVPESFQCVACHNQVTMDAAVLRPAPGIDETQTAGIQNPWLARKRLGFFRAFLATLGKTLTAPGQLLRSTPAGTAYGAARGFYFLLFACLLLLTGAAMGFFALLGSGAMALSFAFVGMWANPVVIIAWFIAVLLWGLAAHLILLVTGGAEHRLSRTYEALCYGAGPMVFILMPCIGPFACIWSIVASTAAFKEAQRVSGGRAALCVVTPPLIVILLAIASYVALMVWLMSSFPGPGPGIGGTVPFSMVYTPDQRAQLFAQEVRAFAADNGGAGPAHGLDLLDTAAVLPDDFTAGRLGTVPHFGRTLRRFNSMPFAERESVLESARGMINDRTVAHRVGDVVFTYHGIPDLNACEGQLWIVVVCADPSDAVNAIDPIWVSTANGWTTSIQQADLPAAIEAQNLLRSQFNLPPLPDPRTVDPDQPAEAE